MSLLVASHLTYCPACRKAVAHYEALGAALLTSDAQAATGRSPSAQGESMPSLDAVLARIDAGSASESVVDDPGTPLPMPIRIAAGARIDDLDWKFRIPGLSEAVLDDYEDEKVSLMRIRPGTGVFHHTHEGEEATLILQGQMADGGHTYSKGEVALCDHTHEHNPRIVGDEICYCLVVLSGNLRFTGPVGRALNLFNR